MPHKVKTDGLGGFSGISNTLKLGAVKQLRALHLYTVLVPVLLTLLLDAQAYNIISLSMILSLQRANETYKFINQAHHCCKTVPLHLNNIAFTRAGILFLCLANLLLWALNLLLACGDVHPNPGPNSVNSLDESSFSSSTTTGLLSNHLSIFHLNVQSILPKIDLVRSEADAYDIAVFSESWLKPSIPDEEVLLENFLPPFRTDRFDRPGGGVIMFVRNTIFCKRRNDLEIRGLEAVWIEVTVKTKKLLIGGFYRPPNSNLDYFNLILESVDRAHNTNITDIIITGDFNYNMLTNDRNKIKDMMLQFNLKQLIQEATHYTEHSSSLIDLILVRNESNILTSGVVDPFIPDQIRYHCPTIVLLKFVRPSLRTYKRKIWYYARADFDQYREILGTHDLEMQIRNKDIDTGVEILKEAIFDAAHKSIPNKIITVRPNDHPWITCHIKNIIRKRKRAYRKFKRNSNNYLWNRYKILRNTVTKEIRKSKQEYFDKLETLINNENSSSKLFWKTSKQILKLEKSSNNVPTLALNNEYAETDLQKANMLNKYFVSQSVVSDENKTLPCHAPLTHAPLDSIIIHNDDVKDVLDNLNVTKSCGPDLMSPRLLKEGSHILSKPYSFLFNSSLQQGYFPNAWKFSNVTPIHKKDDRSVPSNYRPVSLLCHSAKVMERCIHKTLYNYINEHKLLTPFQSGFIQGDSTTFQLLHTYHSFCEAVDNGKEVRVVFCDISKAFDRVWHRGLLHKLADIGCSNDLLRWFSSYLTERKQRVILNGQASEWAFVKAGVPQGSVLGPLMFLVYINDIVNEINASVRLFADDTSLYIIVDNPNTAAVTLNNDLKHITKWGKIWQVDFNPSKNFSMLISRKNETVDHPPLYMDSVLVSNTSSHKHLGLTFSDSCNWAEHIENITAAAWTRLNLIRALKFKLKRKSLEKIYTAFIRPLLEYSDSVWDNTSTEAKKTARISSQRGGQNNNRGY